MKVLHIIPDLNKGGAERLVLDICNQLQMTDGVEVKLVTFSNANAYPDLTTKINWQVVNVNIRLSLLSANKINVEELQQVINDFEPDVIHTHLFYAEIVSRFCERTNAKWFSHGHDNIVQLANFSLKTLFFKKKLTDYYEKRVVFKQYRSKNNKFIAISNRVLTYFSSVAPGFAVKLLHNAINYAKFFQSKEVNSQRLLLINVGSLNQNKNQSFLIEVAKYLQVSEVDFELHLLGNGPDYSYLENKIKTFKLGDCVFLHGSVTNVEEYLWRSAIYLHSSFSEALGLSVIEAMAAGLPVITLDGIGNRDLIEQGQNGYMLFDHDVENFVQTILDLWNNQIKYTEMSNYAQQFAAKFDIKEYTESLLAIYKE